MFRSLAAGALCASLVLAVPAASLHGTSARGEDLYSNASGHADGAAKLSLNASGTFLKNVAISAQVRPGPYFANEALVVQVTVRNIAKKGTIGLSQSGSCLFTAQIVAPKGAPHAPALPPAPLCIAFSGQRTIPAGGSFTGKAMTAIPLFTGKKGAHVQVRLQVTAQLASVVGRKITINPSVTSGLVSVPVVAIKGGSAATPQQTLKISLSRDAQSFTVRAGDGRGKPVSGVVGWYVVHAPKGNLAWGEITPGRVACGYGCSMGAGKGAYTLNVVMVRDGSSLATAALKYTIK